MGSAHQLAGRACVRAPRAAPRRQAGRRELSGECPPGQSVARARDTALRALLHARAEVLRDPGNSGRERILGQKAADYAAAWRLVGWSWRRLEQHALRVSATQQDSGAESARRWRRREEWAA